MRTMSIEGLSVFLGIVRNTWKGYAAKDEFLTVCEYVDQVMYDYKLTGASAGLLNPSIIQRDLGLVDKKHNDLTSGGRKITNNWTITPVSTKKAKDVKNKPKFRYNHKTRKWDQLFTFTDDVVIFTGFVNPHTGMSESIRTKYGSAVHAMYSNIHDRSRANCKMM